MLLSSNRLQALIVTAGTVATLAGAQSAMAAQPFRVVESRFDFTTGVANAVPGLPAGQVADAAAAGTYVQWFNGAQGQSPSLTNGGAIDAFGNVVYYGKMAVLTGAPPTLSPIINSSNQLAIFYAPVADYTAEVIVARDGSTVGSPQGGPAPSNPNNWVLNNISATAGNGLNAGVGMSSNGRMLVTGQLRDTVNLANSTANNNTAFFTGFSNSLSETARRSNAAPGTTDAAFNTALNLAAGNNQVNPSGQVFFSSALISTGGGTDVVTSGTGQNDSGSWIMGPNGGSLVVRRGDSPAFLNGAAFGAMTTNPSQNAINASGNVLFGHTLSTTQGLTPASAANDTGIFAKVGGTLHQVAREGGSVTVAGNAETYISGQSMTAGLSSLGQTWNNNGRAIYGAKFTPSANITAGTNDLAIMTWQGGNSAVLVQSGTTVVPHSTGTATLADLGSLGNSQTRINNRDNFVFTATLNTGGDINANNNTGLWFADANGVDATRLIVQEGMAAPGFSGVTFGNGFFGVASNNSDMVIFQNTLSSGQSSLWAWDKYSGLTNVTFAGDTSLMGANYPVGSANVNITGNGDGGIYGFNDFGDLLINVTSAGAGGAFGSNAALIVVHIPSPAAGSLAILGMGALAARRRRS